MKYEYPFTHHITFPLVMRDPEICKGLIRTIFPEREVTEVRLHSNSGKSSIEETIIVGVDSRQVRLDVRFADDTSWYDIEMQVRDEHNLPKRTRYSHAIIDVDALKPSQEFDELKPSYVIFICCFDYFKEDKPIYRFSMAEEENHLSLGDETFTIVLNSKAGGSVPIPQPLKELFDYMNNTIVAEDNELIKQIDDSVERLNSEEGRRFMATLEKEILLKEGRARKEGRKEGREEDRNQLSLLFLAMEKDDRIDEYLSAIKNNDSVQIDSLLEEYNLSFAQS